jgi:nitrogen-specific signal transduction histidine kinase
MSNRPGQDSSPASLTSGDVLTRLLAALEEGVLVMREGRVASANAAFARMRGASIEACVGQTLDELFTDSEGRPLADPSPEGVRLRSSTGSLLPVTVRRASPEVLIVADRSRERTLEHEVWRLSGEIFGEPPRQSDAGCWEAVLGMVEHEIRTAVTVISGYARMLLDGHAGPLAQLQRNFLNEVQRASKRVEGLLDNLLEIGPEGQPSDVPFIRKITSLHEILQNTSEAVRPLAEERDVHITLALHPDADPLHADPARLEQVVTNLLTNAVKFAPEGSTVRVETGHEEDSTGEILWIAVHDEGPGVHPDEVREIFQPFVRGRASECCSARGVGLGLAICHRIVEAHGGSIEAVPSCDGGLFRVTLPLGS